MPADQDRYRSLIARAAFNAEFFRGTIQDLSAAQRAMTFVGAPSFGMINGLPCLKQNAAGDYTTSAAIPAVLDVTASWSIEALFSPGPGTIATILQQVGAANAGGFSFQWRNTGGDVDVILVYLFDLAAGPRLLYSNNGVFTRYSTRHAIISGINGGASGKMWLNGVPIVCNLFGAAAPANIAVNRALTTLVGPVITTASLIRVFPFALTNADATCLAEQAKLLVGGW